MGLIIPSQDEYETEYRDYYLFGHGTPRRSSGSGIVKRGGGGTIKPSAPRPSPRPTGMGKRQKRMPMEKKRGVGGRIAKAGFKSIARSIPGVGQAMAVGDIIGAVRGGGDGPVSVGGFARRRINPYNKKALNRSVRRLVSFAKGFTKVLKTLRKIKGLGRVTRVARPTTVFRTRRLK